MDGPNRKAMLAVAVGADQAFQLGMSGVFPGTVRRRARFDVMTCMTRAHDASSVSVGNMISGGMMLASSLRCSVDGPWHDMQPTPFDAWRDCQALLAEIRHGNEAGAVVGELLCSCRARLALRVRRAARARPGQSREEEAWMATPHAAFQEMRLAASR